MSKIQGTAQQKSIISDSFIEYYAIVIKMSHTILCIKAYLPLKVASNYAVKQISIIHLSARKMQMST